MKKDNMFARLAQTAVILTLLIAALAPAPQTAAAGSVPTFTISSVVTDTTVTVVTKNFPANRDFTIRMGAYGTLGIGGIVVGTLNSGAGGSFSATFNIPDALKGAYRIAIRMDGTGGYFSYSWFYNDASAGTPLPTYTHVPTFSITDVVKDATVSVKTNDFPANTDFTVRMGAYGTKGIGGIVVGTLNSGAGGVFAATFNIPDALKGAYQIAVRMEAANGYYAYNWFYNNTSAVTVIPGYSGFPTFSIQAVERDVKVKILTNNLPPNSDFTVRMGAYGTQGKGGIEVGKFNSGTGGAQTLEFNIPAALVGSFQIAIRMDATNGFFAYNWFYNNSTSGVVAPPVATAVPIATPVPGETPVPVPPYSGFPTFNIKSVVKDTTVTVMTSNLPPSTTFTVRMGARGTKAVGGIVVGTFDSGAGGAQTLEFSVPAAMAGAYQIAIRMDGSGGAFPGYFAYNWFYNNTTP